MRRSLAILILTFAVSGCAVPMPVTVMSWALDGLSLMSTDKTLADHGLSALAGQDCAIWRGLSENQLCRAEGGSALAIADASSVLSSIPVQGDGLVAQIDGPYLQVR